jgi:hypothetical protein
MSMPSEDDVNPMGAACQISASLLIQFGIPPIFLVKDPA